MSEFQFNEWWHFEYVSLKKLISDQAYQREVKPKTVAKMVDEFDVKLFDPIKVSCRDGIYRVVEGQNRCATLQSLYGENILVPAIVSYRLTYEEEARIFKLQDDIKSKIKFTEKLNAAKEEKDEKVLRFKHICEEYGYCVDFNHKSPMENAVTSYEYLYNQIFIKRGEDRLKQVLRIVSSVYGSTKESTNSCLLRGVNTFIGYYEDNPKYNESTLVSKLKKAEMTINEFVTKGRSDLNHKNEDKYAYVILNLYNKRLRPDNKLDCVF